MTNQKVTVYKITEDDWCPSYKLEDSDKMLVRVSYLPLSTGEWRVCVWGADDCGMERDFPKDQGPLALKIFLEIIELSEVNFKDLKEREFKSA